MSRVTLHVKSVGVVLIQYEALYPILTHLLSVKVIDKYMCLCVNTQTQGLSLFEVVLQSDVTSNKLFFMKA